MDSPQPSHQAHAAWEGPSAMELSGTELRLACAIKQAVEDDPSLRNLSDLEYAQYAVTASEEDSSATILHRLYTMQCFRDEYKISDTLEEGLAVYREFTEDIMPGSWLFVDYLPTTRSFAAVGDYAAFFPSKLTASSHALETCFRAEYYQIQAMAPNFQAMRNGRLVLLECEGTSFANMDHQLEEKFMVELYSVYPKRHQKMMFFNTPMVVNIAHALWKKFLRRDIENKMMLGCQLNGFEGRRLDALYNVPTPEMARENMIRNINKFLEARYRNQSSFSLPTTVPAPGP